MIILTLVDNWQSTHGKTRNIFRLRASDADDDYPLKFSIKGEIIPCLFSVANIPGTLLYKD